MKQGRSALLTGLAVLLAGILYVFILIGCEERSGESGQPVQQAAVSDGAGEPRERRPDTVIGGGVSPKEADKQEAPPPPKFPLTGLTAPQDVQERPVMVMVENSPQARPQTGLDQADLVYEILAEGDITRFAAVYQSRAPKTIGPVRSIRPYYVEIGDGLDAYIVHAGWSQEAMDMLAGRKLSHLDEVYGDGKYYWRDAKRKMPHNLYTSIELIRQGAKDKRFRTDWNGPLLQFTSDSPDGLSASPSGQTASKAVIPYSRGYTVSYRYEAESGTYLRSMNDKPHTDALSGHTLSASNIIIAYATHRVLDSEGRRRVDVFGPGQGVLLQRGTKKDITWERKEGLIRVYEGGKELGWLPGQTWVQIVPDGTAVRIE